MADSFAWLRVELKVPTSMSLFATVNDSACCLSCRLNLLGGDAMEAATDELEDGLLQLLLRLLECSLGRELCLGVSLEFWSVKSLPGQRVTWSVKGFNGD